MKAARIMKTAIRTAPRTSCGIILSVDTRKFQNGLEVDEVVMFTNP